MRSEGRKTPIAPYWLHATTARPEDPDASPLLSGVEERTPRSYHTAPLFEPQEVIQHGTLPQIRAVCQVGPLSHGAPHPPGEPAPSPFGLWPAAAASPG
jgi:hypothetical protein